MIAVAALVIGLGIPLFSRLVWRDFASPPAIYAFVWGTTISLYFLGLVDYPKPDETLWMAIGLSGFCFLAGSMAVLVLSGPFPALAWRSVPCDQARFRQALMLLWLLGAIGLVLQILHLQQTVGLNTFWTDPVTARKLHTYIPVWGYLNLINLANVALVTLYSMRFGWSRLVPFICLTALLSAALTTDRTRAYYMAIWVFFTWVHGSKGLRFTARKVLLGSLFGAVLLSFFLLFASHFERTYVTRYPAYIDFPQGYESLADPYIYLTGSLPALQAFLADEHEPGSGRHTFSPIVTGLRLVWPEIPQPKLQGKLYFVPVELNTYTYLRPFFLDFGWFGIALGPFFCGLLCGWAYAASRKRPGLLNLYLAGLCSFLGAISIFVNHFTQEATWFVVLIGCLTARFVDGSSAKGTVMSDGEISGVPSDF